MIGILDVLVFAFDGGRARVVLVFGGGVGIARGAEDLALGAMTGSKGSGVFGGDRESWLGEAPEFGTERAVSFAVTAATASRGSTITSGKVEGFATGDTSRPRALMSPNPTWFAITDLRSCNPAGRSGVAMGVYEEGAADAFRECRLFVCSKRPMRFATLWRGRYQSVTVGRDE